MTAPSTPIDEALKDCTPEEKAAIAARTPPYDGVRVYGDLLAVRAQLEAAPKKRKEAAE